MEDSIKLSKIDVARRQLETAVSLYFHSHDSVSMHTLAAASHEIVSSLNERLCKPDGCYQQVEKMLTGETKKAFITAFKKPQNFFKHADRDPEDFIEFSPQFTELILYDACLMYQNITRENNIMHIMYTTWFRLQNPSIFQEQEQFYDLASQNGLTVYGAHEKARFFSENIENITMAAKFFALNKTTP